MLSQNGLARVPAKVVRISGRARGQRGERHGCEVAGVRLFLFFIQDKVCNNVTNKEVARQGSRWLLAPGRECYMCLYEWFDVSVL